MERVLKPREQDSDFAPDSGRRGLSLMAVSPSPNPCPPVLLLLLFLLLLLLLPSIAEERGSEFWDSVSRANLKGLGVSRECRQGQPHTHARMHARARQRGLLRHETPR